MKEKRHNRDNPPGLVAEIYAVEACLRISPGTSHDIKKTDSRLPAL